MIIEKNLRRIIHDLVKAHTAELSIGGSKVMIQVLDNDSKIFLSSQVYLGGNFIPKSVRNCLNSKLPFSRNELKTYFFVDEDHFQVILNYLGGLNHLNKRMFIDLLEEFGHLADEWRCYLDEHDKNDLIHVRAK